MLHDWIESRVFPVLKLQRCVGSNLFFHCTWGQHNIYKPFEDVIELYKGS